MMVNGRHATVVVVECFAALTITVTVGLVLIVCPLSPL